MWLVALMLVGGILSERVGTAAGFTVWVLVALPILMWTAKHLGPAWYLAGFTTIAAVYAIALAAQLRRTLTATEPPVQLGMADVTWLHLNGLLMFAAAYFLIVGSHLAATAPLAAAFALWQGCVAAFALEASTGSGAALRRARLHADVDRHRPAVRRSGRRDRVGGGRGRASSPLGCASGGNGSRAAGVALFAVAFALGLARLGTPRTVG